jgi:hypothetical protein
MMAYLLAGLFMCRKRLPQSWQRSDKKFCLHRIKKESVHKEDHGDDYHPMTVTP